jgi:hypothetical protein
MIRFKLQTQQGEVQVALDSEAPHKVAPIEYTGDARGIMTVKRWLFYEKGAIGQPIGDWAAPLDLKIAMQSPAAKKFSPTLLEETTGAVRKPGSAPSEG